jgi:hypothetical protein
LAFAEGSPTYGKGAQDFAFDWTQRPEGQRIRITSACRQTKTLVTGGLLSVLRAQGAGLLF